MLDSLRRGATSKVAALIIFIPLIFAFALWGVGPELRRSGVNTLAKVGATEITPDQFQSAYQREIDQLSRQFGRRLTPEQARMFGLEQNVLSRLVGSAAIDLQAKELGLAVSDQTIADSIRTDPSFLGPDGKFSKLMFEQFLRNNNLSEAGYIQVRRREDVREQLTETIAASSTVPQSYIELVHRHRNEERVIEYVTVDPDKLVKVAEPDEAKLKEYYEANKRSFMTNSYRKIAVLLLTRDAIKGKVPVTDEDVKSRYEETKASFNTLEKRRLQQVAFPDKAAAEKAFAELSKAKSFVEAAGKLGFKESDINLGLLTQADLIDPKIAAAAFALKKDEVSQPVEGQFTTVILRVVEIAPGVTKTFDDVKALVRDKLVDERLGRELSTLHDAVESERTAGRSLKEAGEKLGLAFKAIDAVDRGGNGPDGKPIDGIPDVAKLLGAVFQSGQGIEADAVDLADGGFAWFDVLGSTPEKERPFDEVKADVKTRWIEIEMAKALSEATAKLVERVQKGEDLASIIKDSGGSVQRTGSFARAVTPTGLTTDIVRQSFALPVGAASSSASNDGKTRIVFRIPEITRAAPPTKAESDRLRTELQRGMQADNLNAYLTGLQNRYGVSINNAALAQTLGLDQPKR